MRNGNIAKREYLTSNHIANDNDADWRPCFGGGGWGGGGCCMSATACIYKRATRAGPHGRYTAQAAESVFFSKSLAQILHIFVYKHIFFFGPPPPAMLHLILVFFFTSILFSFTSSATKYTLMEHREHSTFLTCSLNLILLFRRFRSFRGLMK